jgi:hypothetical protein
MKLDSQRILIFNAPLAPVLLQEIIISHNAQWLSHNVVQDIKWRRWYEGLLHRSKSQPYQTQHDTVLYIHTTYMVQNDRITTKSVLICTLSEGRDNCKWERMWNIITKVNLQGHCPSCYDMYSKCRWVKSNYTTQQCSPLFESVCR